MKIFSVKIVIKVYTNDYSSSSINTLENQNEVSLLMSIIKLCFRSCNNFALQNKYGSVYISALGNVWYSTILNSFQEFTAVANLIKGEGDCFFAGVGGSTNDNGLFQPFNFIEYVPDTSGRLCITNNFFVSNISCNNV